MVQPLKRPVILWLVAWLCFAALAPGAPPTAIGQRVQTNSTVNVRAAAAGTSLGQQTAGALGNTTTGPVTASLSGTSYIWWNVNFDSGVDGWVATGGIDVVAQPALTVSSPNGSVSWTAGSTQTVSWGISGGTTAISYQHVALSTDGGASYTNISPSTGLAASARSWAWTLPSAANSQCRIRVRAMDASGTILTQDFSDSNFTITGSGGGTSGLFTCPVPSYGNAYAAPISAIFDHSPSVGQVTAFNGVTVNTPYSIGTGALLPMNYQGTNAAGPNVLEYDGHAGVDYKVLQGTTVVAAADGTVENVGFDESGGGGYFVRINHAPQN